MAFKILIQKFVALSTREHCRHLLLTHNVPASDPLELSLGQQCPSHLLNIAQQVEYQVGPGLGHSNSISLG